MASLKGVFVQESGPTPVDPEAARKDAARKFSSWLHADKERPLGEKIPKAGELRHDPVFA